MVYNSNIKILFVSLLAVSILSIGASVLAMDHSARGNEVCGMAVMQDADCSVPAGQDMCVEYHLGLFNKISQTTPAGAKVFLLFVLLFPFAIWLFRTNFLASSIFFNLRQRLRWLWEDLVFSYSKQLWFLALQEKRGLQALLFHPVK